MRKRKMKAVVDKGKLVGIELEELMREFGLGRAIFPESVYKEIVIIGPAECLIVVDDVEEEGKED